MPDENPYLKKLRESMQGPQQNNDATAFDIIRAEVLRLQEIVAQRDATILRLTEEKATATDAAATERGRAIAAEARAMAAERLLAAETKRADDESEECDKYEAECERLRGELIAAVDARARAEATAAAKGKVMTPAPTAPTAQKPIRYDVVRNEVGDIVSITAKPEE